MALSGRIRSGISLFNKLGSLTSDSLSAQRSTLPGFLIAPSNSQASRNYATATGKKEQKVKVPLALYGGSGNYATALYVVAVKANALEKVESEIIDFVEAVKKSPKFLEFSKDLSLRKDTRVKAIQAICADAQLSNVTNNFLLVLAEYGRLRNLERIVKRFQELTMAHKGEVRALVTTVIPLPPQEEKELKETLQEILGAGKKVHIEQKIDPSILGGIMVEFNQKVLDMSIKTRAQQMERFLRDPVNIGKI